jgi:hypothetical protein
LRWPQLRGLPSSKGLATDDLGKTISANPGLFRAAPDEPDGSVEDHPAPACCSWAILQASTRTDAVVPPGMIRSRVISGGCEH